MHTISSPLTIYIADSQILNAGRGVFAAKDIPRGEIIEVCPCIDFPEHETYHLSQSTLANYLLFEGDHKQSSLIMLGYGSIYNHSDAPNAAYSISFSDKTVTFTALKNIAENTEITINYLQSDPTNKNPLWFR